MKNLLAFVLVAMMAMATLAYALPPPPPGRSMGPMAPAAPPPSAPAVDPRVVGGLKKVSDRSKKAERTANQAIREVRAQRAAAAPPPPSPIVAAMGEAADKYTDDIMWSQALARNNNDEAEASRDHTYLVYLQDRQNPVHQIADAKAYAMMVGQDHGRILDLERRLTLAEKSVANLNNAVLANDELTRAVANNAAIVNGFSKDGSPPSLEEKKAAGQYLAGL